MQRLDSIFKQHRSHLAIVFFIIFFNIPNQVIASSAFDFGSFINTPQSIIKAPGLSILCRNQINVGVVSQSTDFNVSNGINRFRPDQIGSGEQEFEAGYCYHPQPWLALAGFVNIGDLSLELKTQNSQAPVLLNYNNNNSPQIGIGSSIRMTDRWSLGFAVQLSQSVSIDASPSFNANFRAITEIETTIRSELTWMLGAAYQYGDFYFHSTYTPAIATSLNTNINTPINDTDLSIVFVSGEVSFLPAMTRFGFWHQWQGIHVDAGIQYEKWSAFDGPFISLDILRDIELIDLDELIYEQFDMDFQNTFNPYVLVNIHGKNQWTYQAGYSYRQNPLLSTGESAPLIGAPIHLLKGGAENKLTVFNKPLTLGGYVVTGFIVDETVLETQNLDGTLNRIVAYIRMDF